MVALNFEPEIRYGFDCLCELVKIKRFSEVGISVKLIRSNYVLIRVGSS